MSIIPTRLTKDLVPPMATLGGHLFVSHFILHRITKKVCPPVLGGWLKDLIKRLYDKIEKNKDTNRKI